MDVYDVVNMLDLAMLKKHILQTSILCGLHSGHCGRTWILPRL